MKELESLQQKLEQLIKRYSALKAENERLEKMNAKQTEIIKAHEEKISALATELQMNSVAVAASGDERQKLKQHLDSVIKEIEKNIELL